MRFASALLLCVALDALVEAYRTGFLPFGETFRRTVRGGGGSPTRLDFHGRMTTRRIFSLDMDNLASLPLYRVACNRTTITLRTAGTEGGIGKAVFQGEPFIVGRSRWRCRPHKRDGAPFYRQVIGEPQWLDDDTVVLSIRKASLLEMVTGKIVMKHDGLHRGVPLQSAHNKRIWRRGMWDQVIPFAGLPECRH